MLVAIGSDHGGFRLKENIKEFLQEQGFEAHDFGIASLETADYPDVSLALAKAVAKGEYERGILICGTGIGVSIAANKVRGIRASLCHDVFSAQMARKHNDANILTMGERVIGTGLARMIAGVWLKTEFNGGRHSVRVKKMMDIEKKGLLF